MGSCPQFVDFDSDGHLDLVSGSYDPGEIYLFRGDGLGSFKPRETLCDKAGHPIIRNPGQAKKVESFGSFVTFVDWDDDGDLDILLGSEFVGSILVRLNEGTRTRPVYSTEQFPVLANGKPIFQGRAQPVIADWDGDGLWDILSGGKEGGAYWCRNIGKRGAPAFAERVTLIPPNGKEAPLFLDVGEDPVPGTRSQIAVADMNGDDKLDILLGDFSLSAHARPDLSPQERKTLKNLRDRMETARDTALSEREKMLSLIAKEMGPPDEKWTQAQRENCGKRMRELEASPSFKEASENCTSLCKAMRRYVVVPGHNSDEAQIFFYRGYVWLYLRK